MVQNKSEESKKKYHATVIKTERITYYDKEEVREIELEVDHSDFSCSVEQCFGVLTQNPFDQTAHHRLYSFADIPLKKGSKTQFKALIKRCDYIDAFTGEEVQGISSNYLCGRIVGDEITVTGPYPSPFQVPGDKHANLIMIGLGTGIAPFRAFISYIHEQRKDWKGKIRLLHGAKTGLELLYANDKSRDKSQYYDDKTYHALQDLSIQPVGAELENDYHDIPEKAEELLDILWQSNTYIYVAGQEKISNNLDKTFSSILGSSAKWAIRKNNLKTNRKWIELIY